PLPVSLLDFYAGIENKKIKITWSTTTEMDNNFFEIERSTDGRIFHKIGEVAGHGNSNNMHHYIFYDEQPFGGKIFYRLRQVDINGQYSYSNTRIVMFGSEEKFSVYPNPLASAGKLTVFMAQTGRRKVNVTIHDINGRILHTSIHQLQQNNFLLEPYLAPGVYFLKIQGEQFSSTKKIIVTR
ncbi:MAG: T9SS type A sorting domain-containing protein, partial [Chitinophagaceae bacterium]